MKSKSLSQIEEGIIELQRKVDNSEKQLREILANLDAMNGQIEIENNFLGLVKSSSIENALKTLSSNTAKHFEAHHNGLSSLTVHINEILSLFGMLSAMEADLYCLLDDSTNITKEKIEDIIKSSDEKNRRTSSHIKGSFEKILILRDRLNVLKEDIKDINTRVSALVRLSEKTESDVRIVKKTITEVEDKLNAALEEVEKEYSVFSDAVVRLSDKTSKDIAELNQNLEKIQEGMSVTDKAVAKSQEMLNKMEETQRNATRQLAKWKMYTIVSVSITALAAIAGLVISIIAL